jgi:hypothetical protein
MPTKRPVSFLLQSFLLIIYIHLKSGVADPYPNPHPDPPDPRVFGPPGSEEGSISQKYGFGFGSGSFYHQVN